tara:strand:- start:380 stop:868 length:489 start_codon:yes stop_codon:yes gene_type:complete
MLKNQGHEFWNISHHGSGIQGLQSFCPEGYYPIDGGKYCQMKNRGPSGYVNGIMGRNPELEAPVVVPSRLISIKFVGSTEELVLKLLDLNQSYFNNWPNRLRVERLVSTLREDYKNGYPINTTCRECLGTNDDFGTCIEGICLSEITFNGNREVICTLKLRY